MQLLNWRGVKFQIDDLFDILSKRTVKKLEDRLKAIIQRLQGGKPAEVEMEGEEGAIEGGGDEELDAVVDAMDEKDLFDEPG